MKLSIFHRKGSRGRRDTWVVAVEQAAGDWKQHRCPPEVTSRPAAKAWAAEQGFTDAPEVRAPKPAPSTVRSRLEQWVVLRKRLTTCTPAKLAPSTVKDNRAHLKSHVLKKHGAEPEPLGDIPLDALSVARCRLWLRELREAVAANTCRNVVFSVRVFLDDAIAEGWTSLERSPLRDEAVMRELPEPGAQKKISIPVATAQALITDELLPPHRQGRYLLAFTTGERDSELAGLPWRAWNREAPIPFLTVDRALRLYGAEGKMMLGETKTKSSRRTIPTHPAANAWLAWWWSYGWALFVGRSPKLDDPIFPGQNRAGAFSRPDSAGWLERDLTTLKLPTEDERGNRYQFRHTRNTFATLLRRARVELALVQRLMGHRPATVTDAHYADEGLAMLLDAVKTLPFTWSPVRAQARIDVRGAQEGPETWSHLGDSNPGPAVYESDAGAHQQLRAMLARLEKTLEDARAVGYERPWRTESVRFDAPYVRGAQRCAPLVGRTVWLAQVGAA